VAAAGVPCAGIPLVMATSTVCLPEGWLASNGQFALRTQKGIATMRDDALDFTPERNLYTLLRPKYGREACLLVPNASHGLAGYVTFDGDAHRLHAAVEQLGLPQYLARTFQDGTVLWLIDANAQRAQALEHLGVCSICFAFEGPWDIRQQLKQQEET
jgi:hypothetical protein